MWKGIAILGIWIGVGYSCAGSNPEGFFIAVMAMIATFVVATR